MITCRVAQTNDDILPSFARKSPARDFARLGAHAMLAAVKDAVNDSSHFSWVVLFPESVSAEDLALRSVSC